MILPRKQVSMNESYFGFGGFLLQKLASPISIEDLWDYYKAEYTEGKYPVKFSFDQYIMALDYLFIIGAITKDERGLLCYETVESES